MRYLICDLKRLFSKKGMVVMFILAPAVIMLLFVSVIVPMLFTGRGLFFNLAIYQEDNSLEVNSFVYHITHVKSISELTRITEVDSLQEGIDLLEANQVSVFLHIPSDIMPMLQRRETVTIPIYSTKAHAMEQSLITMTLGQALLTVGQSQNQLEGAKEVILSKGVPLEAVDGYVYRVTMDAILEYMDRRQILGKSGTISPMGDYLPVEYYLAAVFAMFAALAMLPMLHFTAADLSGSIFHRGLASGRSMLQFLLARLGSGALFIMLVLLMVFPTSLMLKLSDALIGGLYNGSLLAQLGTIILGALCLSALSATLAVWIGKAQPAIWAGFYLVIIMSVSGGALIPDGALPAWLSEIGRFLPLRSIMRSLATALFNFDAAQYTSDMLRLLVMTVVLLILAWAGFARKERGR